MTTEPEKQRKRQAVKQAIYYRNYRRARDRALVRLAQANPAQYKVFLEEERERDIIEGKEWKNLRGTAFGDDSGLDSDTGSDT
jgi:hypothetical protein